MDEARLERPMIQGSFPLRPRSGCEQSRAGYACAFQIGAGAINCVGLLREKQHVSPEKSKRPRHESDRDESHDVQAAERVKS